MGFGVDRRCYEDGGTESQRRGGAESFFRKVSPIVVDFRTSSPGSLSLSLSLFLSLVSVCPRARLYKYACVCTRFRGRAERQALYTAAEVWSGAGGVTLIGTSDGYCDAD